MESAEDLYNNYGKIYYRIAVFLGDYLLMPIAVVSGQGYWTIPTRKLIK